MEHIVHMTIFEFHFTMKSCNLEHVFCWFYNIGILLKDYLLFVVSLCLVGLCKRRMSSGILSLLFCGAYILNISGFNFGKLLPNLDQKNLIFTYTQDILCKKKSPNSPDFKIFSLEIFSFCVNNRFLLVAMNIEGSFHPFFSLPSIVKS